MTDFCSVIPIRLAADVADLEGRLSERLSYWDNRYHSIEGLLCGWADLVASCSTFADYVEVYLHALGGRDILLDIMLAAEGPLRAWLVREVDQIDDLFIQASDLDRANLMWGGNVDQPCNWWHRRIPRNQALREQIETIGPGMRSLRPYRKSG